LLSNKSSPGNPRKRYFNGDKVIDKLENLCTVRALEAFRLDPEEWAVNVQTLSGSLANLCAFHGLARPGETILALDSKYGGGHHTHGLKNEAKQGTNLYSQVWNFEHYGVDRLGFIDYDKALQRAEETKPKIIICGASSYPREIDYLRFRKICDSVGAIMLVDIAHEFGLKIAGVNSSPFPYADIVTASASKSMRGPRAGVIYSKKQYSHAIDAAVFPGILGAPQNGVIGSLAIAFKYCATPQYKEYASRVVENAMAFADELIKLGNKVVTGGTDTNIIMWDIKHMGFNAATFLDLAEA